MVSGLLYILARNSLKVAIGNTLIWSNPEKKNSYLLWMLQKESSLIFFLYISEKKSSATAFI